MVEAQTLSLAEAAKVLGISGRLARDLAKQGRFPVPLTKIGGRQRVKRPALERYLNDQEQSA